jgi:hypothetical protein
VVTCHWSCHVHLHVTETSAKDTLLFFFFFLFFLFFFIFFCTRPRVARVAREYDSASGSVGQGFRYEAWKDWRSKRHVARRIAMFCPAIHPMPFRLRQTGSSKSGADSTWTTVDSLRCRRSDDIDPCNLMQGCLRYATLRSFLFSSFSEAGRQAVGQYFATICLGHWVGRLS